MKYILFSFSILCIGFLASCSNDLAKVKALTEVGTYPDITVKNLETMYSTKTRVKVKLNAPLAEKYISKEEPYTEFRKSIHIIFYDDSLNIESELTAGYAIYYDKNKLGRAEKNVVLTNVNGSVLRTEQLFIDENSNKIYSIKPVRITDKDGSSIYGQGGLESNLGFTAYKFSKVKGENIQLIDKFIESEENVKAEKNK